MASNTVSNILKKILNPMLPINMLLRLYSLCILMVDITWVIVNTIYAVAQAAYELVHPPPLKSLSQETAMVIGSGRGVGKEIAIQLADLGAIVLCVDLNETNNQKTVEQITLKGGKAYSFTCDVTMRENVANLATEMELEGIGFVSMLFYCCGIPSPRFLMTKSPQDIHAILDLTLTSYFYFIDQFTPEMKKRNHGHIVALTSVAGLSYIKDHMPLSVAQFAVQGLAESLMEDLRMSKTIGVHVTLTHIYPFIVEENSYWRLKIPSYFGTITPEKAAASILDSVRRNYTEASVPKHLLYLGHALRILPRKATQLIRDLLDTGVDFA